MAKKPRPDAPPDIVFDYIKGNLFRVIHCDGVIGGVTPSGNLHMAFFSERPAIPRTQVHSRNEMGTLGPPIPERSEGRPGVVREMDIDVVISPRAVDALVDWLNQQKERLASYEIERARIEKNIAKKKTNGRSK